MEHALSRIGPEVPGEDGVGHFHPGRGGREPRPEDEAVSPVGQVVREGEGLLGQPREPVTHPARERGEERESQRHVRHDRGRERGVEPVHHPDRRLGDHQRAPYADEEEQPLRVVLPRAPEGGAEEHPGEPGDAGQPGQRHEGPATGDRGDRVQEIDEIGPAAQGEEFIHGVFPSGCAGATGTRPRRGRRRAPRGVPPREHR